MSQSAVSMPTLAKCFPGSSSPADASRRKTAGSTPSHNSHQQDSGLSVGYKDPAIGDDSPQPIKPSLSTRTTMASFSATEPELMRKGSINGTLTQVRVIERNCIRSEYQAPAGAAQTSELFRQARAFSSGALSFFRTGNSFPRSGELQLSTLNLA